MSSTVGLADEHRLEAPRQRRVLLDVLAVLVERGGADAVQLAARQRRLQHVGGVHRALGLAGADQGVQLVDEQDDVALGRRRSPSARPSAAPRTRRGYLAPATSAPRSSDSSCLSLQRFRHVAVDDAQRQALDDGGLADAGLADQHRVVLGAARQHLDGAADLLVAADHRIELALARRLGEVAGVFLQRVVAVLGRRGVGGAALAQLVDGLLERLRRDAGPWPARWRRRCPWPAPAPAACARR